MQEWWAGSGATAATAPHSGSDGATLVVARVAAGMAFPRDLRTHSVIPAPTPPHRSTCASAADRGTGRQKTCPYTVSVAACHHAGIPAPCGCGGDPCGRPRSRRRGAATHAGCHVRLVGAALVAARASRGTQFRSCTRWCFEDTHLTTSDVGISTAIRGTTQPHGSTWASATDRVNGQAQGLPLHRLAGALETRRHARPRRVSHRPSAAQPPAAATRAGCRYQKL